MACADEADALVLVNPLPPLPWSAALPARDWPDVVPWSRDARLASTRRALPDSDAATVLFAFPSLARRIGCGSARGACGNRSDTACVPRAVHRSTQDEDVPPG
jgi:hypothetical protein